MFGQSIFTASSGAVRHIHRIRLTFSRNDYAHSHDLQSSNQGSYCISLRRSSHRTHHHDHGLLLEHPHESKRNDGRVTQYGPHFLVGFVGDREMETAKVTSEYWS